MLRAHSARTAANSAAYLLESGRLKEDSRVLDIGCGPATITCDFAALASKGQVIGIETNNDVLEKAREVAKSRNLSNIEFQVGDIHALNFPDASFDVVHVHQVLQHIPDPVQALREMLRVTKPGGVVASKTADLETLATYPDNDGLLAEWNALHMSVARGVGGQPDAGRKVLSWAKAAGAKETKLTASVLCLSTPEGRHFWASTWQERMMTSFKDAAVRAGVTDGSDLQKYLDALLKWEKAEGGTLMLTHAELLCFV